MSDYPVPRTKIRMGDMPYKFREDKDFVYSDTGWKLDKEFDSMWLKISTNGEVTVKANYRGYAWDGCTPKKSILNLIIIGVPDGHVNHRTMKPYTYYASMVHDALYQYLDSVPIQKKDIDLLFLKMLGDFKLRRIYYFFVNHFGGMGIKQNNIKKYSDLARKPRA
ncbi:hypothetical protein ACFL0T_01960 [Candidatus Omnitrophota bacterium]